MVAKRTLYEIVGVPRNAHANEVKDAYEGKLRSMANRHDPEAQAERALLRNAFDVLFDKDQRARYDQRLRDEAMRAVAVGVADAPELDANPGAASPPLWRSTWFAVSITALLVMAGAGWKHYDGRKKAEALRIERERLAAEQERIAREQAEQQRLQQSAPAIPSQADQEREAREMARYVAEKRREAQRFQYEQDAAAQRREWEARQAADAQRRAEYEQQQREQMDRQRAEQQLARERQLLQEIENSRRR